MNILLVFFILTSIIHCQTIKQLNEITIKEELPIGSIVTFLTDKIPNLDQSIEYDLVAPLSSDLDLFSIDHNRHSLNIKKRIDFEQICSKSDCVISISIAVSNHNTIDVYILPIRIENINDNPLKFLVNRTVIEIEENDEYWFNKTYSLPRAIDADGDLISYSIYLQNWQKPNGLFEFDEKNLILKPSKKFDREQQNLYVLRLIAQNKHEKDVSIDVIIMIKDINDNPPRCQFNETLFYINNFYSKSIFTINVTDLDEGDNARLEYQLNNPLSGFNIDHSNGEITFDYTKWNRRKQSKLYVNIRDYGKPNRLSTQCIVEFKFTFLYEINFEKNDIENVNLPIGQFKIFDQKEKKLCLNCMIYLNSSLNDSVYLNNETFHLYFNLNSIILNRILSNNLIKNENLVLNLNIHVIDKDNPSIISTKNYSLNLKFNKEKLLINSNILFLRIHENSLLNEKIQISNHLYHHCLNNQSKQLVLSDPTNTFEIDNKFNLIIKKYLNIKQQQNYQMILKEIQTNQTEQQCSIQLHIQVYNSYSLSNVSPYFSRSFYILTSNNLSGFILPLLPSYVKYISSKSNEISIDEKNGSIKIQSSSLYSLDYYDFQIKAIDSRTPSLSCSIPIRIFFGINHQSPRLINNITKEFIEISSEFIYEIKAYDPDLSLDDQNKIYPPSIEYNIEPSDDLDIERYTGRIFLKNLNKSVYNFTLILTDFGQPNRLITQQRMIFKVKLNEKFHRQEIQMISSSIVILISTSVIAIIILFIIIVLIFNHCHWKSTTKKSLANLSPTTPDSRLIDNEYITTTTSLPRVINREQRIFPTNSNDNQRKLLEQIQLPPPSLYAAEKVFIKQDYQHNLSMNDINKYLERFEKIYNNSTEHHLQESVGSVV